MLTWLAGQGQLPKTETSASLESMPVGDAGRIGLRTIQMHFACTVLLKKRLPFHTYAAEKRKPSVLSRIGSTVSTVTASAQNTWQRHPANTPTPLELCLPVAKARSIQPSLSWSFHCEARCSETRSFCKSFAIAKTSEKPDNIFVICAKLRNPAITQRFHLSPQGATSFS